MFTKVENVTFDGPTCGPCCTEYNHPLPAIKWTMTLAGVGLFIPVIGPVAGAVIGAGIDLMDAFGSDELPEVPEEIYPETTLVEEIDPDFID